MDEAIRAKYQARADVLKSLAHPTRLFIVDELSRREMCVRDITRMVGADMSTVSRHLSVLRNAGVVGADRRGSQVYYSLKARCVTNFFGCVEGVLKSSAAEQAAFASKTFVK